MHSDKRKQSQSKRIKQNQDDDDDNESDRNKNPHHKHANRDDQQDDDLDGFLASDDQDLSESYVRRPIDDDSGSDYSKNNKKKHKKKKSKKSKKKKRKYSQEGEDQDQFDQLDDLMEQNQLRRLKKNKARDAPPPDQDSQEQYRHGMGEQSERDESQRYQRAQYSEDQYSRPHQIEARDQDIDMKDIFDEQDLKKYNQATGDQQIVEKDLPERKIHRYANYSKVQRISVQKVKEDYEAQDRTEQAKWIYQKLRQQNSFDMHDEKLCRQKIFNVLNALHKENLQIMYIYYYRKKLWQDALNLNLLLKIDEIDEQWMSFKKQFNKLKSQITFVIESFQEVPVGINDTLKSCTQFRTLKYFKDYVNFVMSKRSTHIESKSNNKKINIIRQICQKNIDQWIEKTEVFLSPQNLCLNFKNRIQQKKPKTPQIQPDTAISQLLKKNGQNDFDRNRDKRGSQRQGNIGAQIDEKDWADVPLLSPEKRIVTICNYLALELFNYPQLRKILKQKYYKRLIMSTYPTVKGSQNITVYNSFFPVKRIKEKPVSSLKKQVWILANEAQKLGLITIELKFQWQLSAKDEKNFEGDSVYLEMVKYYFDLSTHSSGQVWNLFRKQVLIRMLTDYFFPAFIQEVRQDLTRQGHKQIIEICCDKFKKLLRKGAAPSIKEGKPIKILSMALQKQKLGIAFVDEQGKAHTPTCMRLHNDEELKKFVGEEVLYKLIQQNSPDMILVSANCRRAQTLRKQLRSQSLFPETIFCAFGEYQIPNLVANKNIIQGVSQEKAILAAVSMARFRKNPMAEILSLWSDNVTQNGLLSLNFHPLQKSISQHKLLQAFQRVAIQVVNLVGLNINQIICSDHLKNQLQFICGMGPRKAFDLMDKLKSENKNKLTCRKQLAHFLPPLVYKNCAPFLRVQTDDHRQLLQKVQKDQKNKNSYQDIRLLDMTRIPEDWYYVTEKLFVQAIRSSNLLELKQKKSLKHLPDEVISVVEMLRHPEKMRGVEWDNRKEDCPFYDEALVKSQLINRFSDPRDKEQKMDNKDLFYSLLKQTPETLRKYMIVTVKILSVHNQSLNVVIPQNGLFGNIKIHESKPGYEKGNYIKAIITSFPFDQRKSKQHTEDNRQLLKVQMSLSFPHKSEQRNHDCFETCFPSMVRQMHPLIDLDKGVFDLKKQDKPIIEVREEAPRMMNNYRKISHPKFKNVTIVTALQQVKSMPIGDFIIRPSTQGSQFLTITWHFYKNIVTHIKLKSQQKSLSSLNFVYRILDKDRDKIYSSLEQVIQRHIKPMNALVQDVISNKKFSPESLQRLQDKIKTQMAKDSAYIHYFFTCSQQYPQFFILIYMYKQKKPTKQLIRVRNSGIYFHDQCFQSLRELIVWFKQHLKEKQYQKYARSTAIKK